MGETIQKTNLKSLSTAQLEEKLKELNLEWNLITNNYIPGSYNSLLDVKQDIMEIELELKLRKPIT